MLKSDLFGFAVFQLTALPAVFLWVAWRVYPTRAERGAADSAGLGASYRWIGKKLLIPPLLFVGSGLLSLLVPGWTMGFFGLASFAMMWFWIFFIAYGRQQKARFADPKG